MGSALIARLAQKGADRIVTLSRDEHKRAALQAKYRDHPHVKVYAGDVRDEQRLQDVFAGCEVVVHAAARKVVSGHHDEAREMHLTNVIGTANVLAASRRAGVSKVLFISSDKAVHPQNVYGVSKSLAEHLVISENARCFSAGMRASVIRYGNVLASNGSVVRVWRDAADAGLPLRISDRRMTRFWLTLPMAVGHVIHAIGNMRGGEVMVPPLRAAPLVRVLEAVAGPDAVETVQDMGIRPGGEKMHECLISEDEARRVLERHGWYVVPPADTPELWDRTPWLGDSVQGRGFTSDTWPDEYTVSELRELV